MIHDPFFEGLGGITIALILIGCLGLIALCLYFDGDENDNDKEKGK